ncbi:hypothetical protein GGP41_010654 [Bipolaris sorokiniana]|uniref:Uncharacterized protein n=1 Tax=Cochliobolus sativus TaxID=45130 RepID=A0A8H5ZIY7_COCSA|nr:hypothetical protein GGP41_010654 [Bipolaris sorokiniana]
MGAIERPAGRIIGSIADNPAITGSRNVGSAAGTTTYEGQGCIINPTAQCSFLPTSYVWDL